MQDSTDNTPPTISIHKKITLGIISATTFFYAFFQFSKPLLVGISLTLLAIWAFLFTRDEGRRIYHFTDWPILFLLLCTLTYGRAFSRLGIQIGPLPLYVTEIALGLSLVLLLVFKRKKLIQEWDAPLPRGLAVILAVYFIWGSIYMILGYKAYGSIAFRDIVFCHYLPFLFIALSLFSSHERLRRLFPFISVGAVIVLFTGFGLMFGLFHPGTPLRQFVKATKMTNFALYAGLIGIFSLSYYAAAKKKMKIILAVAVYISILVIILYEVRSAWAGIIAVLIFLGILLKKEFKIMALIIAVLAGSLFIIDHFGLTFNKNKLKSLKEQVNSMAHRKLTSMAGANIRWRLDIWGQTFEEVKEFPAFGWGFGAQVNYIIWKKPLSWLKARGSATGFLPPHNHLMSVVYKMGFFGLLLFIIINLWIFLRGLLFLNKCQSDFNRRFLIGSLGALVYWHSMAFFFDILESPPTGIFLWIILGAILSVVHIEKKKIPVQD